MAPDSQHSLFGVWRRRRNMPVFTIKAKDNLALRAVDAYRSLCVEEGLTEQAEEVVEAYAEMVSWRLHHPDLCHQPDHKHVAVFKGDDAQREPTVAEAEEIVTGEPRDA